MLDNIAKIKVSFNAEGEAVSERGFNMVLLVNSMYLFE